MTKKGLILLISFILAGLALRVLFIAYVPTKQVYDFATYQELALNIKNGLGHTLNGVSVAWQGPLYPYALGIFYKLTFTGSEVWGKIFNISLSTLTLLLSYFMYIRLFKRCRPGWQNTAGLAALALLAFLPANIAYVNVLGTEVLFVFLLIGIILLHLCYSERKLFYTLIGAMTGLATLTKPYMLAFPVVLAVAFWFKHKCLKSTAVYTAIITLCMLVVVTPWTIRNYRLFGRIIFVSYNGGYVRFINNNDNNNNGLWMDIMESANAEQKNVIEGLLTKDSITAYDVKASPELEPVLSEFSRKWILENPFEFIKLGLLRVMETFFNRADDLPQWAMNGIEYKSERDKNVCEALLGLVHNLLSVCGLLFVIRVLAHLFRRKSEISAEDTLVAICIIFFVAVVFVSEGQARYALPVYPFFVYAIIKRWDV